MLATIYIHEFEELIELFEKDADEKVDSTISLGRLFIKGSESELMLRFNPYSKKITIARIQFKNPRSGYGGMCLELLKEYGEKNGYQTIEMESVLSIECYDFVMKKGFERVGISMFTEESEFHYYGNYELDI